MSNRKLKVQLFNLDPRCHWCGKETILTNIPNISKKTMNPLMATIDHIYSRFDLRRWVKSESPKKVLACYQCNNERSIIEEKMLTKEEIQKRGNGFSFNPRGKPVFRKECDSVDEVLDKLKERGIVPTQLCMTNS